MSTYVLSANERQLVEFLRQSDGAIFIGAGISAWSGIPTWDDLLHRLLRRAEEISGTVPRATAMLQDKEYLSAAEEIQKRLTPSEISQILRSDARYSDCTPHQIHDLIFELGFRRFITTNYDCLLEQRIASEGKLAAFRIVTHRNVAELADIQKAGADNFVFKLHGDINDASNIILSKSSYEQLLDKQKNPALRALGTIFASRPVLFLGYSLSDPDLQLVLTSLNDEFEGNAGQRWAVVPDATQADVQRFWSEYRVRIVPYQRMISPESVPHFRLVEMLQALVREKKKLKASHISKAEREARTAIIALRNAASLMQINHVADFNIRAHLPPLSYRDKEHHNLVQLSGATVSKIIEKCDDDIILCGQPGTGKSQSLKKAAYNLSKRLISDAGQNGLGENSTVPVLVPMQAYDGSFANLVSQVTPEGFEIEEVAESAKVILMLDSIDEMAEEYLSSRNWIREIEQLSRNPNIRTVFSTRRADLVGRPEIAEFQIRPLENYQIERWLTEKTNFKADDFKEVWDALRQPFVLSKIGNYIEQPSGINSQFELMECFTQSRISSLSNIYDRSKITTLLMDLAAHSLHNGRVTISVETVNFFASQYFNDEFEKTHRIVDDIVNAGILASELKKTVRFAHHSFAEFFASRWIAQKIKDRRFEVQNVLHSRFWDDTLTWVFECLDISSSEKFFTDLFGVDPQLAIRALVNSGTERHSLWRLALSSCVNTKLREDDEYEIAYFLHGERVSLPVELLPELEELHVASYQQLSSWALGAIGAVAPDARVLELLERAAEGNLQGISSRWFVQPLGRKIGNKFTGLLKQYIKEAAARAAANSETESGRNHLTVLCSLLGIVHIFSDHDLMEFLPWISKQNALIRENFVSNWGDELTENRDFRTLSAVNKFLRLEFDRCNEAAWFRYYLNIHYRGQNFYADAPNFTERRLNKIIRRIESERQTPVEDDERDIRWTLALLAALCDYSSSWSAGVMNLINSTNDAEMRCVLECVHPALRKDAYDIMYSEFLAKDPSTLSPLHIGVLGAKNLNIQSATENNALAYLQKWKKIGWRALSKTILDSPNTGFVFDVNDFDRWVEISKNLLADEDFETELLGNRVAHSLSDSARARLVSRSQDKTDKDQEHIIKYFLFYDDKVLLDNLNDETVIRLIRSYIEGRTDPIPSPGHRCSERLIERLVLPWLRQQTLDEFSEELALRLLADAGETHDKRYFLDIN